MDKTFIRLIQAHINRYPHEGVPMRNAVRYATVAGPHRQIYYTDTLHEQWLRIEWADGTHAVLNADD